MGVWYVKKLIGRGEKTNVVLSNGREERVEPVKAFSVRDGHYIYEGFFVDMESREAWRPSEEELKNFFASVENGLSIQESELMPELSSAGRKLKAAALLNRPCIARFHNDADGIIAAILLSKINPCHKVPQNVVTYGKRDALADLSNFHFFPKPLAVALDFGSSEESLDAYDILSSGGAEVLVIDHHPYDKRVEEKALLVNPLKHELPSDYTTGYIMSEIIKQFSIDIDALAEVSLAGDKSELGYSEDAAKTALALDYAAYYTPYGLAYSLYTEILHDKEIRNTLYEKAKEALDLALKRILQISKTKTLPAGFTLYFFDAEDVGEKYEFPGSGKMATLLAEHIREKKPEEKAIVLSVTSKMLSFRLVKRDTLDLSKFVDYLVEKVSFIVSGGGHANAASFKIRDASFKDEVVAAVVAALEDFLKESPQPTS